MSDDQPIENFWEEWTMDPMLSSGQQLYASGATASGAPNPVGTRSSISSQPPVTTFHQYICYLCPTNKTFNRLGDLTHHLNEKHNPVAASKYLCPIPLCPRGINGEGFCRMHHLVAHLKSKKHGMQTQEAAHLARMHNLPKSKGQPAQ